MRPGKSPVKKGNLMDFTLVIRGTVDSKLPAPALTLNFKMSNLDLAKLYAKKSSLRIANRDYTNFALFRFNGEEQDLVQEWQVSLVPTIVGDTVDV
jgi:hypothetical protein